MGSRIGSAPSVIIALALTAPAAVAQGLPPAARGALAGGALGGAAGLLFAHDACDGDPCSTGAYVLATAGGSALFAGLGAVVGSRVAHELSGGSALTGAVLAGLLGGVGGAVLVASTCDRDECGVTGYTAVVLSGAAVLGTLGSLIGGRVGRSRTASRGPSRRMAPVIGVSPGGVVLGIRTSH